jgi:hypothetical protein
VACSDGGSTPPLPGGGEQNNGSGGAEGTGGSDGSGGSNSTGGAASTGGSDGSGGSTGTGGDVGPAGGGGGTTIENPGEFSRPMGKAPNNTYPESMINQFISPQMGTKNGAGAICNMDCQGVHDQPQFVNGYLMLCGEGDFAFWNIEDPTKPQLLSEFEGQYSIHNNGGGEAEAHQVTFAKRGTNLYTSTISGKGITFWDITDPKSPKLLKDLTLPGINFGDVTAAVWGVNWQGDYVYVGGTDQGLFVVNAKDPANPTLVKQMKTNTYGGFSAGPVHAVGDLLVIMSPKNKDGIATLDISDPANPQLLTSKITGMTSYIGGFFGGYVFMLEPARAYDVTTNPLTITQVGPNMGCKSKAGCDLPTPDGEYMSFSDNMLLMGQVRNTSLSGATIFDFTKLFDPTSSHDFAILRRIKGRRSAGNTIDDQFNLRLGALLVFSDDELANRIGSVITVQDTQADTMPPVVHYTNPKNGATGQDVKSRIGVAFSDLIELTTLGPASFIVRPMGGQPLKGQWNHTSTVTNFTPEEPLQPATTYEIILPKGGITDLVGNGIPEEFRATFTTK